MTIATTTRRREYRLAGYDDLAHHAELFAKLNPHGLDEVGLWQIEQVTPGPDGMTTIVVVLTDGAPAARPAGAIWTLSADIKSTDAPRVSAEADSRGLTMIDFSPNTRPPTATAAALPASTRRLRDRFADHLKCAPHLVEIQVEWGIGRVSGLGEITVITVLRAPAIAVAERRREAWLELVKSLVPAPEGTTWWLEDETSEGRLTLRRAEDPLGEIQPYPWDAKVDYKTIPFGVDSAKNPLSLGLLELNQLLGGTPGGGKSGGITALLCGISRLKHVALVGLDPKVVEMDGWKARFSRIATREDDALEVLEALTEEMEARYDWLAERGLKKFSPSLLSDENPLIVLVIDELADLVSVGVTKEEKDADLQRSTRIRRLIAKGRAAGLVVIAATQKPQSDVVPTALRDLIQLRVAYACTTNAMTDTVLGAGMSQNGGLSHEIPSSLRGLCYIVSETSRTPTRARTYWVPDADIEGIVAKVAHLRVELPWMPVRPGRKTRTPIGGQKETVTQTISVLGTMDFSLDDLEEETEPVADESAPIEFTKADPDAVEEKEPDDAWWLK